MNIFNIRRPDTSNALIHLTGNRREITALDAIISILQEGQIRGSGNDGYIKGNQRAACFTEMPLSSIYQFVLNSKNYRHSYELFGIVLHKQCAWERGLRPVIYLPDDEAYWIPDNQRWRHVRFEYDNFDFSHEREWRIRGDFSLDGIGFYVIVPDFESEQLIRQNLHDIASSHILGFLHMNVLNDLI
jgi:hypothetical protein